MGVAVAIGLLAVPLLLAGAATAPTPGQAAASTGAGTVEGEVALRPRATRTAERYVSSTGEPRDIEAVPAVVYIQGPVASAPPPRGSGPLELVQRGEAFRPSLLVVPVGARVAFPNDDPLFHNVFSYSRPKRFDLGRYPKGESKAVVFDRPGYVKVLCEVHKWMRGGILVVDNPFYAIVQPNGRFRIDDVPAGRYRVVVEHFERRTEVEVNVQAGTAARISVTL